MSFLEQKVQFIQYWVVTNTNDDKIGEHLHCRKKMDTFLNPSVTFLEQSFMQFTQQWVISNTNEDDMSEHLYCRKRMDVFVDLAMLLLEQNILQFPQQSMILSTNGGLTLAVCVDDSTKMANIRYP